MRTLSEISLNEIEDNIYKKDIYFFNKKETALLKGIRKFLRDPENFSTKYYKPITVKDSLRYVYPEKQPSFHKDETCPMLQSNFINFEIPEEIREKGENEVKRFRSWYAENKFLLENDEVEKFILRMQANFFITREINPKSIELNNSGSEKISNYSIQELENEIDNILREAGKYYRENPEKQNLIKRYGKLTFLGYIEGNIFRNDSGLNDEELKDFLRMYEKKFKKPVKDLLLEYYRLLHNPEMDFKETVLEVLGFKPCGFCLTNETE